MSFRFLYVMDPPHSVDPNADTTFDFLLESQARGHTSLVCTIDDLYAHDARGFAVARPITVRRPTDDDPTAVQLGPPKDVAFDDCDVVWMRKDPPVDDRFMLATMILDRHDPERTLMMNDPTALRVANEKLWALFAANLGPPTVVSARPDKLLDAIARFGTGVLKPIGFAGGAGVMVFSAGDKNAPAAVDVLTENGKRPALVQRYLDDVRRGDKRVILLGGQPIGAMWRVPQASDNRANMHVGGAVQPAEIDDDDRRVAAALAPALVELGLHFVGIDMIGGRLTEVNVTSPTGIQEIDRLDGRRGKDRLRAQVLDYVEGKLGHRPGAR